MFNERQYSKEYEKAREYQKQYREKNKERKINVDHCHKTGKVRGILHSKCNRLLAYCEDNIERLEKAILYLEKHGEYVK